MPSTVIVPPEKRSEELVTVRLVVRQLNATGVFQTIVPMNGSDITKLARTIGRSIR